MHSSGWRGSDFRLRWHGEPTSHAAFFRDHDATTRVGLFAPERLDGLGAITLALACVTAFYDRYRERGQPFFAYPDFFTFQRRAPVASYAALDFWPQKDLLVSEDPAETAAAMADRAIDLLLVPDGPAVQARRLEALDVERMQRNVRRCFAYGSDGAVDDADLVIECDLEPLRSYGRKVAASVQAELPPWLAGVEDGAAGTEAGAGLRQGFREVGVLGALARL